MSTPEATFAKRWWIYQHERFPLLKHGLLIGAFSFCAVSVSRQLRGAEGWPHAPEILVSLITCFTFFLQLRIADEFKDYEEDLKHRPYRPVQRGLVTLRELGVLFVLAAALQLGAALWLDPRLVPLLLVTWTYLAAMSREFFVADWLRKRPILYMVSHMAIMPLVDLYATSSDWLVARAGVPSGLIWFLCASYFNGLTIELGRKIRSPADEEPGVETYSVLWGRRVAVTALFGVVLVTAIFGSLVAWRLGLLPLIGSIFALGVIGVGVAGLLFLRSQQPGAGKWIENATGVWTLLLYISLGVLPHLVGKGPT